MKLFDLFESYQGPPIEQGGTAMKITQPAPSLVWLINSGYWNQPKTVLDYGAGHGRNANYLRLLGHDVYAYDPFNGTNIDGWNGVSNQLPDDTFDIALTCYVLNVVPKEDEKNIIEVISQFSKSIFHITRNMDIADMAVGALEKHDRLVWNFWKDEFLPSMDLPEDTEPTKHLIIKFCEFGFQTSKGFQRIPLLEEDYGFNLIRRNHKYKIYSI